MADSIAVTTPLTDDVIDGLTIGQHEIQVVQAVGVGGIKGTRHHAMHGKGGDSERGTRLGRRDDLLDGGLIVYSVYRYAKDILLATVNHATRSLRQRSTLIS